MLTKNIGSLKTSDVLHANKEIIISNAISFYQWNSTPVKESIKKSAKHMVYESPGLANDMNYNEVVKYLLDYFISLNDIKVFTKWIKELKWHECGITQKKLIGKYYDFNTTIELRQCIEGLI